MTVLSFKSRVGAIEKDSSTLVFKHLKEAVTQTCAALFSRSDNEPHYNQPALNY